jgi:hypothetical protein
MYHFPRMFCYALTYESGKTVAQSFETRDSTYFFVKPGIRRIVFFFARPTILSNGCVPKQLITSCCTTKK